MLLSGKSALRVPWLPILGCAVFSALGCDAVTAKRTTEQVIPVEPSTTIHVENHNGWIRVRPGPEGLVTLRVHRRVTAVKGGREQMDRLEVTATKEQGMLRIRGRHPADPKQRRYQIALALTVPRTSPLRLHTERGRLDLADLDSDVIGRTEDGEVRIQDVTGSLDLQTGAGNIQATGIFQRLRLETQVGRITTTLRPGSRLSGECSLLSRRGSVSITLPEDLQATVTAEAHGGAIRWKGPLLSAGGPASPGTSEPTGSLVASRPAQPGQTQSVRALLAGGGPALSLVSHRGDVMLHVSPRPGDRGTAEGR